MWGESKVYEVYFLRNKSEWVLGVVRFILIGRNYGELI